MKKFYAVFILLVVSVFAACKFEVPQTIAVKVKSNYGFSLGNYTKDLSEYISFDTIKDSISSDESNVKFNIYDYNPGGNSSIQQYMLDFIISEIPVDVGSYLKEMNFSEKLKDVSFDKEFSIPKLSMQDIPDSSIPFPDVNRKVREQVVISEFVLPMPGSGEISNLSVPVDMGGVTFETMEFKGGYLDVEVTAPDNLPSTGVAMLKIGLGASVSNEITVKKGNSAVAHVPLAGEQIGERFVIRVFGASSGASSSAVYNYKINCKFSEDLSIHKVSGITIDLGSDSNIPLKQTVKINTDDTFVNCKIKTGGVSVKAIAPEGWSNVGITSEMSLSGGISADNEKFAEGSPESGKSFLFNRILDLAGCEYSTGDIELEGLVKIELNNSTLVLDGIDSIDTDILCDITSVSSVTVNIHDISENLTVDTSESLPQEVEDYVEYIKLLRSGYTVEYVNDLPTGNDVKLNSYSDFFDIKDGSLPVSTIIKAASEDSTEVLSNGEGKVVYPARDSSIDFKVSVIMPGITDENPDLATFTDIELGQTYKFSILINPVFDWENIALKLDNVENSKGMVNTNFSMGTVFDTLSDTLGDETIAKKMDLVEVPVYLYAVAPEVKGLDKISFSGTLDGKVESEECEIMPNEADRKEGKTKGSISILKNEAEIKQDSDGVVITDLDKIKGYYKADIASLLNLHSEKSLELSYDFTISDADGNSYIEINKNDISEMDAISISLHSRIVIKLKINITEDLELDALKLGDIDSSKDLFQRTEPTDFDDFEKYMDTVRNITVLYSVNNSILNYVDSSKTAKVEFVSVSPEINKNLTLQGGTLDFSLEEVKSILRCEKFTPTIMIKAPKGTIAMFRGASIGLDASLILYADGQVVVY